MADGATRLVARRLAEEGLQAGRFLDVHVVGRDRRPEASAGRVDGQFGDAPEDPELARDLGVVRHGDAAPKSDAGGVPELDLGLVEGQEELVEGGFDGELGTDQVANETFLDADDDVVLGQDGFSPLQATNSRPKAEDLALEGHTFGAGITGSPRGGTAEGEEAREQDGALQWVQWKRVYPRRRVAVTQRGPICGCPLPAMPPTLTVCGALPYSRATHSFRKHAGVVAGRGPCPG